MSDFALHLTAHRLDPQTGISASTDPASFQRFCLQAFAMRNTVFCVILALITYGFFASPKSAAQLDEQTVLRSLLEDPIIIPDEFGGGEIGGEIIFSADQFQFNTRTSEILLTGAVEIYGKNFTILADEIYLNSKEQSGRAIGNVVASLNGSTIALDSLIFDSETSQLLARNIQATAKDLANATARQIQTLPDGRTLLDYVSYSPCQTCLHNGTTPLWHVEARQIELDQNTLQLYLYDATLHLFGVPILPIPYMRQVAPGVQRLSGILDLSVKDQKGADTAVQLSSFFTLNDSLDITLTPQLYLTDFIPSGGEVTLEYRQAIANGSINADLNAGGVVSKLSNETLAAGSDRIDGEIRLFGDVGLNKHIRLNWDWTETSDDDYDEDIKGEDAAWTENKFVLEGFYRRNYMNAKILDARPPTASVDPLDLHPDYFPATEAEFISEPDGIGVVFRSTADLRYMERGGTAREYARIASDNRLDIPIHLGNGFIVESKAGARADAYFIQNYDLTNDAIIPTTSDIYTGNVTRFVPYWQAKLDWPIAFISEKSTTIIKPTGAFTWVSAQGISSKIPNDDNRHAELDAANLFAVNRSGGWDWIERGMRGDGGIDLRSVTAFDNSVFDQNKSSSMTVNAFAGLGIKLNPIDKYDANSGLKGHLTELVADIDATLTNFGRLDIDTRWDIETQTLTRGLMTTSLQLPHQYSIDTRTERQVWKEQNSWAEEFSVTGKGLIPITTRQFWNTGFSVNRDSDGKNEQWVTSGISGELGSSTYLYPWKYNLEYKQRIDGTHGQKVSSRLGYDCDCADFFIETNLESTVPNAWAADVSFKFNLITLVKNGELNNLEKIFGFE